MTLQRLQHAGAAPATGLASPMGAADGTFTILSGTGWPDGSVGPFFVCIDPGAASEEKILCSGRSGTTLTVAPSGRGSDQTSAQAHSIGTTNVQHVFAAEEADDDNDHIYTTTRDDHTQYARTDGTRAITGTQHFNSSIVVATGETITAGGATITAGGLTVTAGGILVASGTTAVQALTTTGVTNTGNETIAGTLGVIGATTAAAISGTTITGTGEIKGTDFNATGLTGATIGGRFVGATAGGPPALGTFVTGDYVVDTKYGIQWVCTAGGTSGTWVNVGGGNVYCQAYRNTSWTTSSSGATVVFDTAQNDPNSMLTTGSGTITVPVAGFYQIVTQVRYLATSSTGSATLNIDKNGSPIYNGINTDAAVANNAAGSSLIVYALLAASDALTVNFTTSTNALTGTTGAANTFFHVRLT